MKWKRGSQHHGEERGLKSQNKYSHELMQCSEEVHPDTAVIFMHKMMISASISNDEEEVLINEENQNYDFSQNDTASLEVEVV